MLRRVTDKIGRDLLANSGWLMMDKLVRLFIGLAVGVLVARYLGPEKMGVWNYGLAIFAFFSVFSSLGLESIAPRELVQNKKQEYEIIWSIWLLKLLGAIVGLVLSVSFIYIVKAGDPTFVFVVLLLSLGYLFQSLDVVEYWLQARLAQRNSALVKIVAYVLIAGYKYYLITSQASLLWFVVSSTLEFALVAIGFIWVFYKTTGGFHFVKPNLSLLLKLLRNSLPFALSALVILLHSRLDQVFITEYLGESKTGIYGVAIRVYELFVLIPAALTASYLPVLSEKYGENEKQFRTSLKQLYSLLTYAALAASAVLWFLGPWVMDLLYGEAFTGAGQVIKILGLGLYPTFLGVATGSYIVVRNLKRVSLMRSLLGLLLSVVLNLSLLPYVGLDGAVIAKVVSVFASTLFILFIGENHRHGNLLLSAFNWSSIRRFIKY